LYFIWRVSRSDHLSDFELYVMLSVAALGEEAYGVTITERIADRTSRDISIGAVYATLGRLADKGFIEFSLSAPEPVRGGRSRKLVSLTPAGARALRQTTEAITRMLDGVILKPATGSRR
jgi:PadR family transcriptional regulator PadR